MTTFGCVGTTIRLESGRYLDLVAPDPADILLTDIAGALSRICRFGGHVPTFYSVAEHSWHCADQARMDGASPRVQWACLMHDAAEAYLGDVVKPLKVLLADYGPLERGIEAAIDQALGPIFSVTAEEWAMVKEIDRAMLIAERRALFSPDKVEWVGEREVRTLTRDISCNSPGTVNLMFLGRAFELQKRQVDTALRACEGCGREYWVRRDRPDPWRCARCR